MQQHSGRSRSYSVAIAAAVFALLVVQIALAGGAENVGDPNARASGGVKKKIASLQRQINELRAQVGQPGPQGPPGPATGPASGDLTGNYPGPEIAPDAVGTAEVGPDALGGVDIAESTLAGVDAVTLDGLDSSAFATGDARIVRDVRISSGSAGQVHAVAGVGTVRFTCQPGYPNSPTELLFDYQNQSGERQTVLEHRASSGALVEADALQHNQATTATPAVAAEVVTYYIVGTGIVAPPSSKVATFTVSGQIAPIGFMGSAFCLFRSTFIGPR